MGVDIGREIQRVLKGAYNGNRGPPESYKWDMGNTRHAKQPKEKEFK